MFLSFRKAVFVGLAGLLTGCVHNGPYTLDQTFPGLDHTEVAQCLHDKIIDQRRPPTEMLFETISVEEQTYLATLGVYIHQYPKEQRIRIWERPGGRNFLKLNYMFQIDVTQQGDAVRIEFEQSYHRQYLKPRVLPVFMTEYVPACTGGLSNAT